MKQRLFVGIDGGATHSTAVAALPDGRAVAIARGEGLNFNNVGTEKVRLRLEAMVNELARETGLEIECVCAGMAALDKPADTATTRKFTGLLSENQLDLQSDAYIALMGLTRGQPGMIAICGTGSMLMLADGAGNQHLSGGWGYLMDDAGSGYAIAREGLLSAIACYEGVGPETPLVLDALEYFGTGEMREIIDCIYAPDFSPDRLAGFARHVLARADHGDNTALEIIKGSMGKLARQAAALFSPHPEARRIGLYGGIFAHSALARAAFSETLLALKPDAEICAPDFTPELGAIIHLLQKNGLLTEEKLLTLKESYERLRK